ncbi:MAG: M56 family metallopeptidase [Amylibacter sp.]|nr:M56 family metallopeptidase [Amylibacter sp.]
MTLSDAVLNTYINANIMLIFAFGLWSLARFITQKLQIKLPYILQLRLLNGIFLAIALSPIAILALTALTSIGAVSPGFSLRVSDFAIAQYLNGSIEMKAVEFEHILGMRNTITENILTLKTPTGMLITGFFTLGFVGFIGLSLLNIFKLRKILCNSYPWRQYGSLKILLSDKTFIPFSTRSLKTRFVVIPSGMLANSNDLKMALAHEFQHMRQSDVEWAFVLEALRPLFFWNPVFYFWKRQVQHLRELACDQQLVAGKKFDAKAYCECLLQVCQNSIRKRDQYSIALPSVPFVQVDRTPFGLNAATALKQRIIAMAEPATASISNKAFACILIPAMALVILASLTIQAPTDWSQDRLMLSAIVNLERMQDRNTLAQK